MLISFKKTILAIYYLILLTYSFSCCAIDINTALSNAYQSSIKFKLLQDKFFQQANQHLKIYANFLPEAHTSISSGKRYHHNGNNNWSSSGNWLPNKHATNNLSNVELSISQNLFNGGQDLIRLKINKQEAYTAKEKFYHEEQGLIYKGIEIYLDYYSSIETSKLYKAKVYYFQKMLEIENQKQSLGESNSVNVANAQVGLTKAMFEHMASITAQQNIEKKFYNFFSILPSNIELPTISNDFASNEAELVNLGLNNSFVLNSYKNQILEQQLKVKFQRAAVLPKINARFSIRSPLPLLKPQEYLTTADFVVAITIPIFNYNTAFLEARSETRALNMLISQYKDILEEIKVSIVSELKQYNSIKQQVEYSKDYVKFISIALTATQHEYELGNIRITDLLKVQNSFYDAQIEDIKVNVELLKHMYKIKQLTNQLTAKALNLQVDYFIPEQKIKFKN